MSDIYPSDGSRSGSLGDLLRSARDRQGLELADIAEVTNVRREYLVALEEGRYNELPEDVYTRNFVKLYAQAVDEEPQRLLEVYTIERGNMVAFSESAATPSGQSRSVEGPRRNRPSLGPWLSSLLLIAAVVLLALWGFNATLFNTTPATPQEQADPLLGSDPPAAEPAEQVPAGTEGGVEPLAPNVAAATTFLTIVTDPPGAEVSIDAFTLAGVTPIENAPVTALESRLVQVSLEGYEVHEERFDLTSDRRLEIVLTPLDSAEPSAEAPPAPASDGTIVVDVTETTWLEVYQSEARNEGERLVYATAEPGERFEFDLPVYIHVGNGAGVQISVGGQDVGALGGSGEVTGRPFTR